MKRLFAFTCFIMFLSCSVDDDNVTNTGDIQGTWERSHEFNTEEFPDLEEGSYEAVAQYKFLGNNNFERYSFLRNTATGSIHGYRSKYIGTYSTERDRMELVYDQYNSNAEASDFKDLEELILVQENKEWSFDFSVNNDELVFEFDPCGPSENCIGELKLKRV